MITDVFLTILIIPINIFITTLQGITSVFDNIIPDQIFNSIQTVISYLGYFNGIFPIDTLIFCVATLINFHIAFYLFKILQYGISIIPFLGTNNKLPTVSDRTMQQELDDDQIRRWRGYVKKRGGRT